MGGYCKTFFSVWVLVCFMFLAPNAQGMSTFIPGAHDVEVAQYDDLTTNHPEINKAFLGSLRGEGRNFSDWDENGKSSKPAWTIPQAKVPGIQINGIFGDSHFVIRIPDNWNGKLVVGAPGGTGSELSADSRLSDFILTKFDANGASYAYAYTDKGARGEIIPSPDGKIRRNWRARTAFLAPEDSIEKWNSRMRELTIATKEVLVKMKGKKPIRTYISGQSNGGYVTRYALENSGELYDGGIDWEGVLWTPEVNNISIKVDQYHNWKIIRDPKASAEEKAVARQKYGLPPASDFLMINEYKDGKDLLPDSLRVKYDPGYKHRDWWEYGKYPEDYETYNWHERPASVKKSIEKFALTGKIKKPMISLAGTWDVQINPIYNAVGYDTMIKGQGQGGNHRLYLIEHANHTDGIVGDPKVDSGKQLQAILPYSHQAFDLLVDWVENGNEPPASKTIGMPQEKGKVIDIKTDQEVAPY